MMLERTFASFASLAILELLSMVLEEAFVIFCCQIFIRWWCKLNLQSAQGFELAPLVPWH